MENFFGFPATERNDQRQGYHVWRYTWDGMPERGRLTGPRRVTQRSAPPFDFEALAFNHLNRLLQELDEDTPEQSRRNDWIA
jgi:hypothetical protein